MGGQCGSLVILIDISGDLLQMVLMIICICNHINCRSVRDAMDAGALSPHAVQAHHGCRFNCGKCSESISRMIAEHAPATGQTIKLLAAE